MAMGIALQRLCRLIFKQVAARARVRARVRVRVRVRARVRVRVSTLLRHDLLPHY